MLIDQGIPAAAAPSPVHEGIDLAHIDARAAGKRPRSVLAAAQRAASSVNVGALVLHKGQRYLIDAAAQVVREVPDARFVILGEGELHHDARKADRRARTWKHVLLAGFRQ